MHNPSITFQLRLVRKKTREFLRFSSNSLGQVSFSSLYSVLSWELYLEAYFSSQ